MPPLCLLIVDCAVFIFLHFSPPLAIPYVSSWAPRNRIAHAAQARFQLSSSKTLYDHGRSCYETLARLRDAEERHVENIKVQIVASQWFEQAPGGLGIHIFKRPRARSTCKGKIDKPSHQCLRGRAVARPAFPRVDVGMKVAGR